MNLLGLSPRARDPARRSAATARRLRCPWWLLRRRPRRCSGSATSTRTATRSCCGTTCRSRRPATRSTSRVPGADGGPAAARAAAQPAPQGARRDRRPIMTLGLSLPSWIALIAPYLHDDDLSLLAEARLRRLPDRRRHAARRGRAASRSTPAGARAAFYLLSASIVALLVTDFVYGLMTAARAPTTTSCGSTSAGSASTCCGAPPRCTRRWRELDEPSPGRARRSSRRSRLVLLDRRVADRAGDRARPRRCAHGDIDYVVDHRRVDRAVRARRRAHGRPRAPAGALASSASACSAAPAPRWSPPRAATRSRGRARLRRRAARRPGRRAAVPARRARAHASCAPRRRRGTRRSRRDRARAARARRRGERAPSAAQRRARAPSSGLPPDHARRDRARRCTCAARCAGCC